MPFQKYISSEMLKKEEKMNTFQIIKEKQKS